MLLSKWFSETSSKNFRQNSSLKHFEGVDFNNGIKKKAILLYLCVVWLVQSNHVWQGRNEYFFCSGIWEFFTLAQKFSYILAYSGKSFRICFFWSWLCPMAGHFIEIQEFGLKEDWTLRQRKILFFPLQGDKISHLLKCSVIAGTNVIDT